MVGKRIESRGQAAAPELQDPLAALDRAHKPAAGRRRARAATDLPEHADRVAGEAQIGDGEAGPGGARGRGEAGGGGARGRGRAKPVLAAPVTVAKPVPAPAAVTVAAGAGAATAEADRTGRRGSAPRPIVPAAAPPKPAAPAAAASKPGAMAPAVDPAKAKGKFTLHLSTFATADEASAFAQRYPGAFVVSGEVPGRGMTYRVRYGNFPTFKDATCAKDSFEKQHGTSRSSPPAERSGPLAPRSGERVRERGRPSAAVRYYLQP